MTKLYCGMICFWMARTSLCALAFWSSSSSTSYLVAELVSSFLITWFLELSMFFCVQFIFSCHCSHNCYLLPLLGCKIRRLTSTVWKDFSPRYNDGKLIQAVCKHCNEVMAAGRDMGTSGVRRHLATCPIRSDLRLIVDKLKSSVTSPNASVLKNWEFDQKISR